MPPLPFRSVATAAATASLAATAAMATLAGISIPSAAPAGAATPSAQSVYDATINAVSQKGVHFESIATQSGTSLRVVGDTGVTSGVQTLTVTHGTTVEHVRAMVVGSTGYVQANSTALHNLIGLPSATATKYAGKWLSFPTSNGTLASLVAGLKNSEVVNGIKMGGPFKYDTPQMVAGHQTLAVRGHASTQGGSQVPVILYVNATGTPKPLKQVTNPGASNNSSVIKGTVTFTHWGENSKETAPSHTVSLLALAPGGSSASSG